MNVGNGTTIGHQAANVKALLHSEVVMTADIAVTEAKITTSEVVALNVNDVKFTFRESQLFAVKYLLTGIGCNIGL